MDATISWYLIFNMLFFFIPLYWVYRSLGVSVHSCKYPDIASECVCVLKQISRYLIFMFTCIYRDKWRLPFYENPFKTWSAYDSFPKLMVRVVPLPEGISLPVTANMPRLLMQLFLCVPLYPPVTIIGLSGDHERLNVVSFLCYTA